MTDVLDALGGHQAVFDAIKAATRPCSDGTCIVSGVMISVQDFVAALPEDVRRRIAAEARQHGDGGMELLDGDPLCARCGCYLSAHDEDDSACPRVPGWRFLASPALPDTTVRELLAAELEAHGFVSFAKTARGEDGDGQSAIECCVRAIERVLSRQRVDDRMREALTFYRDAWQNDVDAERTESGWTGSIGPLEPTDALLEDKGERARAALEGADHG